MSIKGMTYSGFSEAGLLLIIKEIKGYTSEKINF
jgi:hypothetical protein